MTSPSVNFNSGFGCEKIFEDWYLIDSDPTVGFDRANDYAIGRKVAVLKARFIDIGKSSAAFAYTFGLGEWALTHAAGLYAYVQVAPATAFQQYFYANAIHEIAMAIMNFTILGISAAAIATVSVALIVGVLVTKGGVLIYNLCVDKEWRINLSLLSTIQNIFWRV